MITQTPQFIISDIVRNTGINAISEREQESVSLILQDEDLSNEDKTTIIMDELRLRGSLYRKDIFETLELYIL